MHTTNFKFISKLLPSITKIRVHTPVGGFFFRTVGCMKYVVPWFRRRIDHMNKWQTGAKLTKGKFAAFQK
jgi:hypothetical protein